MDRTILHCDLNGFYASVELLSHPELRQRPVAVCGDPDSRHGIVLAKNEAAKAFGVKTAETIWQARRKCPELVLLSAHHQEYHRYSKLVNEIYLRYTDLIEPFGIDESWLDVTGSMHLFGNDGRLIADQIRQAVRSELGLTLSIGVSFNKVFAKLGSDYKKPDATTQILRSDVPNIVWPLPVTDLLFVGRAAARLLHEHGVNTIGELAAYDRSALIALLGKQGGQLSDYARGLECSPVSPAAAHRTPKSVGNGTTFSHNLTETAEVRRGIALLSDHVAARLRHQNLKCASIQVQIRDPGFQTISRQKPLTSPTYLSREISEAAMELVLASWNMRAPIRMLTVTALNLVPEWEVTEQLDLFSSGENQRQKKLEQLEKAVDSLRGKYGTDMIVPGSLLSPPKKEKQNDLQAE